MGKTFRMITAERVAMLMLATALALWGVIELCVNKQVASEPDIVADTIIIEKIDSVIPAKDTSKRKKEKKKSSSKKSSPKSTKHQAERDYFDDQLTD